MTKRRVQRGALSVVTTQRTISTLQNPVVDETDPEVTFKTLSRATAAVAKPASRTTATRGGIAMASERVKDWAQTVDIGLNTPTSTPTFGRRPFTPTIPWCYGSIRNRTRYNEAGRPRLYRSKTRRTSDAGTIWTIFSRIGEIRGHGGVGKQIAARDEW